MLIDTRGLKHPEPLQKLRESFPTMCSIDGYVDVLVDDDKALHHIKTYAAISGCTYEISRPDDYFRIRITSPCA